MFELPKRKVLIKPVMWAGWLPTGHSGAWLNDGAVLEISVPINRYTGELYNPLTQEEIEFFEDRKRSGMDFNPGDLNPYRKPDEMNGLIPFWYRHTFSIRKPDTATTNDTVLATLDLSKPIDYLNYKLLLANKGSGGIVTDDWEGRFDQATHRIVLVEDGYDTETKATVAADRIKAYEMFGKMQHSQPKLYEFLSVYWLENPSAMKPSVDQKLPVLVAQVEDIIASNARKFLEIVEQDYESKLLIHNGIKANVLKLIGNMIVLMPDEIPVGNSLKEAILYFKDERHQEDRFKLIAQIDAE